MALHETLTVFVHGRNIEHGRNYKAVASEDLRILMAQCNVVMRIFFIRYSTRK